MKHSQIDEAGYAESDVQVESKCTNILSSVIALYYILRLRNCWNFISINLWYPQLQFPKTRYQNLLFSTSKMKVLGLNLTLQYDIKTIATWKFDNENSTLMRFWLNITQAHSIVH